MIHNQDLDPGPPGPETINDVLLGFKTRLEGAQFENPMTFVRAMRGAALSIFVALIFCQRPMKNQELCRWTGYKDDNIREGLRLLMDLGWVVALRTRGPWTLADGRQLPLMDNPDLIGVEAPTTATVKLININTNKILNSSNSSETTPKKSGFWSEHQKAIWRICRAAGIGEPTRSQIVESTSYPPEYILAHALYATGESMSTGLLVHRIRSEDWLPETLKFEAREKVDAYYEEKDFDKGMP